MIKLVLITLFDMDMIQCGYQSETFDEYDLHMKSHKLICELCQVIFIIITIVM